MNTNQLAAEYENFPPLLSEVSEQESAGGQLFSLAKLGERRGSQETSYNPPSTASEERTSTLSQGKKLCGQAESTGVWCEVVGWATTAS